MSGSTTYSYCGGGSSTPQIPGKVLFLTNNIVPTIAPDLGVDTVVLQNGDRYEWNGTLWVMTYTPRYVNIFVISDWVVGATDSTITITQATHLRGTLPIIEVEELVGAIYRSIGIVTEKAVNGDIVITVPNGLTFDGRYIII